MWRPYQATTKVCDHMHTEIAESIVFNKHMVKPLKSDIYFVKNFVLHNEAVELSRQFHKRNA